MSGGVNPDGRAGKSIRWIDLRANARRAAAAPRSLRSRGASFSSLAYARQEKLSQRREPKRAGGHDTMDDTYPVVRHRSTCAPGSGHEKMKVPLLSPQS